MQSSLARSGAELLSRFRVVLSEEKVCILLPSVLPLFVSLLVLEMEVDEIIDSIEQKV